MDVAVKKLSAKINTLFLLLILIGTVFLNGFASISSSAIFSSRFCSLLEHVKGKVHPRTGHEGPEGE
jgi:nucleoside permease NupC